MSSVQGSKSPTGLEPQDREQEEQLNGTCQPRNIDASEELWVDDMIVPTGVDAAICSQGPRGGCGH